MQGDKVSIFFTGEGDVGKTTLICWCTYKALNRVVINLGQKDFQIGGKTVKGLLWDHVFGNERVMRYRIEGNLMYKMSHAICLCFSLNDKQSFERLYIWHQKLVHYQIECPMFLVGCKADLKHVVTDEEIQELVAKTGMTYFETSSVSDTGVTESIQKVMETAYEYSQKKATVKVKQTTKPVQKRSYCKS